MGLAGPKNRTKISHDPNNTTWSRSTTRFGHRILTAQGWTPGATLNPDAKHATHYTAGTTSHIRIALKEDTLGLGASRSGRDAETFGLSQLSGLLGRLNGKGEEVLRREEEKRRDVLVKGYVERRYGGMRFVSGGFLVGDRIEDRAAEAGEHDVVASTKRKRTDDEEVEGEGEVRSLKKQKSSKDLRADATKQERRDKASKASRKEQRRDVASSATAASSSASSSSTEEEGRSKRRTEKAERRRRKAERKARKAAESAESATVTTTITSAAVSSDEAVDKVEKKRRKEEKKAKKEAKRLEKEAKRLKRQRRRQKEMEKAQAGESTSSSDSKEESSALSLSVQQTESQSTPVTKFAGGRHAVRQRYIRSKKMASMDPQALKEIFMIKAQA